MPRPPLRGRGLSAFAAHILRWRGAKPRSNVEDARPQRALPPARRLVPRERRRHAPARAHARRSGRDLSVAAWPRQRRRWAFGHARRARPFRLRAMTGSSSCGPCSTSAGMSFAPISRARGAAWLDDPMNEDPRFARVRIRQAMPALEAAGLSAARIAQAAQHLARAREALDADTERFLSRHARFTPEGTALLDGAALAVRAARDRLEGAQRNSDAGFRQRLPAALRAPRASLSTRSDALAGGPHAFRLPNWRRAQGIPPFWRGDARGPAREAAHGAVSAPKMHRAKSSSRRLLSRTGNCPRKVVLLDGYRGLNGFLTGKTVSKYLSD